MSEWGVMTLGRTYRGCELDVNVSSDGRTYWWAVRLPGFDTPLTQMHAAYSMADAQAVAERVADEVHTGLTEWAATGRAAWEPVDGDANHFVANVGGLRVRARAARGGGRMPSLGVGLGSRAFLRGVEMAVAVIRDLPSEGGTLSTFDGILRDMLAAMEAGDG